MGASTVAILCYGADLGEEEGVPWYGWDDFEDWWYEGVKGFEHSFEIWDEDLDERGRSRLLPGVTEAHKKKYYGEYRAFQEANPPPAEPVRYGSDHDPRLMLAVRGTPRRACGYAAEAIENLWVRGDDVEAFLAFFDEHGIEHEGGPRWLLASYWG